jgi:hypothetical protein
MCLQTANWTALALPLNAAADPDTAEKNAERMLHWAAQQNIVLATYIAETDVIPVPLGAIFSGNKALNIYLQTHAHKLAQDQKIVTGHYEYILQIAPEDTAPDLAATPLPSSGGGFLQTRKARRDVRIHRTNARQKFVQTIADQIGPLTTQSHSRETTGKPALVDMSVLVARSKTADVLAALQQQADNSSALGLCMRLIGPNPAYSFVQGAPSNG